MFNQAAIYLKEKQYDKAISNLLKITTINADGILVDDSYYLLAEIYKNNIKDPEKASEYYQKIIFDKPSSIYLVNARKKYRELRGDVVN
jgi:tetratricopeptide (TPR) repeat protein